MFKLEVRLVGASLNAHRADSDQKWRSYSKQSEPYGNVSRGYWREESNQRKYFAWLSTQFNIKSLEDWYLITKQQVCTKGGRSLLARYFGGRLINALQFVYPNHHWDSRKFSTARLSSPPVSQREQGEVFSQLAAALGIERLEDWYKVTRKQVEQFSDGKYILNKHNNSLRTALRHAFPAHDWQDWLFAETSRNFWNKPENQRRYMDWLAFSRYKIKKFEDWYSVPFSLSEPPELRSMLVAYHNHSLAEALMTIYPEHDWQPWRFTILPKSFWKDSPESLALQKRYFDYLSTKFAISELSDWYRISRQDFRAINAKEVPDRLGGLPAILKKVYPDHQWERDLFRAKSKKSSQRRLKIAVGTLFPGATIQEETRILSRHSADAPEESLLAVEFDLYLPQHSIAFELQGQQHFKDTHVPGQSDRVKQKDVNKAELCKYMGISYIEIPYWWDGSVGSLADTIRSVRSDLIFPKTLVE